MDQQYLRSKMRKNLCIVLDEKEQSAIVQNMLLKYIEEKRFKHVACFLPLKKTNIREIDLTDCIHKLLENGIQCYKPHIFNNEMHFIPLTLIDSKLVSSRFDFVDMEMILDIIKKIDLIICPGLIFNEKGHRIGRGKGYYDKTLSFCKALNNHFVTVGVGFDIQNLKLVEWTLNETDINMDFVMFPASKLVKCTLDIDYL